MTSTIKLKVLQILLRSHGQFSHLYLTPLPPLCSSDLNWTKLLSVLMHVVLWLTPASTQTVLPAWNTLPLLHLHSSSLPFRLSFRQEALISASKSGLVVLGYDPTALWIASALISTCLSLPTRAYSMKAKDWKSPAPGIEYIHCKYLLTERISCPFKPPSACL